MSSMSALAFAPIDSSNHKLRHRELFTVQHRPSRNLARVHIKNEVPKETRIAYTAYSANPEAARRPVVDFHSCVWDGHFVSVSPRNLPGKQTEESIEKLKEEVKRMLYSTRTDEHQQLVFIDKIQRLGLAYHFEAEIDEALQHIYDNATHEAGDLYMVSLCFRVLRQAGHSVSPGIFRKYKNSRGEFDASLCGDWHGLLGLHEAAQLGFKGEHILEEAIAFSSQQLKSIATQLSCDIKSQITRSLDLPFHKRIPRVEARYYISLYGSVKESENDVLLQLAKLDYNAVQMLHQTEISQVSRWWKKVNIVSKLPFKMRERIVEGYAMVMTIFPEPRYSTGRIYMAKLFGLLTVLDDTFDVYGTIEELQPLTGAILMWNVEDANKLQGFAKVIVVEVLNLFREIEEEMSRRGQEYTVSYFKSQMQLYVRCLLDEAKLFHNNEVPTLEEWFKISITTSGAALLVVGVTIAHWELATKEAMDWSVSAPKIINGCGRIGRLIDDIQTYKLEQERGNVASSISCYMKEHHVQEDEAIENLKKMIDEEWKVMNEECMKPTLVPMRLLMIAVNVGRLAEVFYLYGDGYTNSKGHTKEMITSLLVNPV